MDGTACTQPSLTLSPNDLKIIDQFFKAWCEENGVSKSDPTAGRVALSLIRLYQADDKFRASVATNNDREPALTADIRRLLNMIT